jgi:hypothetical protein
MTEQGVYEDAMTEQEVYEDATHQKYFEYAVGMWRLQRIIKVL